MESGFVIHCLRGTRTGRRFAIHGDVAVIGRDPRCEVPLHNTEDSLASARHLEVKREGARFTVRDLGSTNGTFIDGVRLEAPISVVAGTEVECGPKGPLFRIELPTPGVSGRTGFYQALMRDEVDRVATRFRLIIAALVVVIVAGGIGVGWYLMNQREKADELEQRAQAAESVARNNAPALFMLMAGAGTGELTGYCTAFAIRSSGILGTNAHCIKTLEAYRSAGRDSMVRMNGHPDKTYPVRRWKKHPEYDNTPFSPDVAILEVDTGGDELQVVSLAGPLVTGALELGQPIFMMGFPGKVMNEDKPAADLRTGVLSRLTTFNNEPADGTNTGLVWHTALTSKGTSGSPIFDRDGDVVAINNGGLSAREVLVRNPDTGEFETETAYEATGLNFGIRIDTLRELLP